MLQLASMNFLCSIQMANHWVSPTLACLWSRGWPQNPAAVVLNPKTMLQLEVNEEGVIYWKPRLCSFTTYNAAQTHSSTEQGNIAPPHSTTWIPQNPIIAPWNQWVLHLTIVDVEKRNSIDGFSRRTTSATTPNLKREQTTNTLYQPPMPRNNRGSWC